MRLQLGYVPLCDAAPLIAAHELGFAREVADRVVYMDAGSIVEAGSPAQVLGNPQEARTRAFLSAVIS